MPYLPLKGYIKLNNLILWSFKNHKDTFIRDPLLKAHLLQLVSCYKFHNGTSIPDPTIISIHKVDFSNPTSKSIAKVEVVKNILLFAGVLENNSWSFVTSDNFEVFYQRFNVGDINISTRGGAIHSIMTGGYKISDLSFIKPEHVPIPLSLRLNPNVVRPLENCLDNQATDSEKSKVIQSLNSFFNAYRNSNETSWASRILLMVMAFELLFGESSRQKFKDNIQKYSTVGIRSAMKTFPYPIMNTQTGKLINTENLTLNQIWAEEFYKLRHRIIHGDTIYSDAFHFVDTEKILKQHEPHFYIAVNFFTVCLLNKLREIGFKDAPHLVIDSDSKSKLFSKNISGIKNEVYKIEDIGIYDKLKSHNNNYD